MIVRTSLTDEQLFSAQQLIERCQVYDGSRRTPYLSNQFNHDSTMPAFFLTYEGERLVGLLTVYADDDEATLSLLVDPAYRRKGYARRLYQGCCEALSSYPLTKVVFQTERLFLAKHPTLLKAWGLVEQPETEFQLAREAKPYALSPREDVVFKLASADQISAIADFQITSFDNDEAMALRYAREAIEDQYSLLYLLEKDGEVIASCTADFVSSSNYLYALAVAEAYRGQGFGSYLVANAVNDLTLRNAKPFQIAVEANNVGAKRLYERLGFSVETEIVYLEKEN